MERIIAEEIRANGAIPFARFMELALYSPGLGYYERSTAQVGRKGDFYTSVSVGPFFGELLAHRFASWLAELPKTVPLQIVEAGAHDGRLAGDILGALSRSSAAVTPDPTHRGKELLERLEYWIVEPSHTRRSEQQVTLSGFPNVRWHDRIPERIDGIAFANELLDAMPVHSFTWVKAEKQWRERGVGLSNGDTFEYRLLDTPSAPPPQLPSGLLEVLPDGYTVERCPAALEWWRTAARSLRAGKLMTLDYGGALEELLNPGRTTGAVRGYSRHMAVSSVLERPGECDITADVNFTEVQQGGEAEGLKTDAFVTQPQFLTAIARELWSTTGNWPAHQVRQFQTLTHPEHLGRRFRVLVQARHLPGSRF